MPTAGDGFSVQGLDKLHELGEAYKDGDKKLRAGIGKDLRATATELSKEVIRVGSDQEPARGGLRARLASARGGVTVSLSSRKVSVSIRQKTLEGYDLRQIDRGILRHPVYARSDQTRKEWTWTAQRVPEHAYTDVFEKGAPKVRANLRLAIQKTLADIAKDAEHG